MIGCFRTFCGFLLLALLSACSADLNAPLPSPESSGELVVLVRATSTDFTQTEQASLVAFEMDLARAFAKSLGLKVRFKRVDDYHELAERLATAQGHMGIGVITQDWPAKVRFTVPIRKLRYVLVEHEGRKKPPGEQLLQGRTLSVMAHSPGAEVAQRLTRDASRLTVLTSERVIDDMQLLRQVAVGKLDLALTDELHFRLASRLYPVLTRFHELPETTQLVWAFPPGSATHVTEADAFIEKSRINGLIHRLLDRHVGDDETTNDEDLSVFIERMGRLLPHFREEFFAAERESGIDWRLVAAIAYQESHWDPYATSPTGVRGMMMLTEDTADRLNVTDRLDASQSIRAGARYFAALRNSLPKYIEEPDRTWVALASYNIGPGHMNGVLSIAKSLGRDVRSWVELKRVLPLMQQPEYAARLKSGPARGGEAVAMAENVRTFYEILKYFQKPYASFTGPRDRLLLASPGKPLGLTAPKAAPGPLDDKDIIVPAPRHNALEDLNPDAAALVIERLGRGANMPAAPAAEPAPQQ